MINLIRGDTRTLVLTLADSEAFEGGDVVFFTLKRSVRDADADALIRADSSDRVSVSGSTASITLAPADTSSLADDAELVFDWQVVRDDVVTTLEIGQLRVTRDVTIRTEVEA